MITKPMLASAIEDINQIKFPVYASPKLDGIRCLKVNEEIVSRTLKLIPNRYIRDKLKNLPNGLDGELMLNRPASFQEITSSIMSRDGEPDFIYYVFDYVSSNVNKLFFQRYEELCNFKSLLPNMVKIVPQQLISSVKDLINYEEQCLLKGFEGIMVRNVSAPYKCGRSTLKEGYLLKLKRFDDSEALVIDMHEMMSNQNEKIKDNLGNSKRSLSKKGLVPAGMLGEFVVKDINNDWDLRLGTGEGLTQELRKEIWNNKDKYIGRFVKYKYQKVGMKELPRFPVWIGFRDEEDM